eukprot:603566-Pyramimonas_sp.AAC.1
MPTTRACPALSAARLWSRSAVAWRKATSLASSSRFCSTIAASSARSLSTCFSTSLIWSEMLLGCASLGLELKIVARSCPCSSSRLAPVASRDSRSSTSLTPNESTKPWMLLSFAATTSR